MIWTHIYARRCSRCVSVRVTAPVANSSQPQQESRASYFPAIRIGHSCVPHSIMLRKLSPSDMRTLRVGDVLAPFATQPHTQPAVQGIFVAMFSVDVAADVLLTALLCTSLHKSRSNILRWGSSTHVLLLLQCSETPRMYGFLNLLVVYTIRTGTSLLSVHINVY